MNVLGSDGCGMLKIKNLLTGYGKKHVLYDISLNVEHGEIVAIIGPNGAGKSTIQKTICGLLRTWQGKILFEGQEIHNSTPAENIARGIVYAPQGKRVFPDMTVWENLEIGALKLSKSEGRQRAEEMLELFPLLKSRLRDDAGKLSGGEQQMLAIARVLIPKPRLLMFDEPSLGLSPKLVTTVFNKITALQEKMGVSMLIVEQKVRDVLKIANRVYSIKLGKVAYSGPSEALLSDEDKLKELFL